jgi:hypothetical protein
MDGLRVVDASEIGRRDPEVGVPQLALDDEQRNALAGHFDGVGVSKLVRRKASANAGRLSGAMELAADACRRARGATGRSTEDAEERADRKARAELQPRLEMRPRTAVHPDLATPTALAVANHHCATVMVEVALG